MPPVSANSGNARNAVCHHPRGLQKFVGFRNNSRSFGFFRELEVSEREVSVGSRSAPCPGSPPGSPVACPSVLVSGTFHVLNIWRREKPRENMASGGYRSHNPPSSNTTDFLEEWKAKREKMRAKMHAAELAAAGTAGATDNGNKTSSEMNNNSSSNNISNSNSQAAASVIKVPAISRTVEEQQVTVVAAQQKKAAVPLPDGVPAGTTQEEPPPPVSQESSSKAKEKGKSCGPSARKGKGQIEKRKMREKRRSTGVVNIPSAESPDEYDDDEAGQKERKREDTVTQQNTTQNESFSVDPNEWQTESVRNVPNRYKSTNNAPDDDSTNRYPYTDRATCGRYSRDPNSVNSGQGYSLEKKIEEFEQELAKERQENLKLVKLMQDKEELIMKMREEIDLLNRDLDDIEDENKQLKQENKTLLKVVGQLTR